jgi:hypothetical protein
MVDIAASEIKLKPKMQNSRQRTVTAYALFSTFGASPFLAVSPSLPGIWGTSQWQRQEELSVAVVGIG